ncbi:hypothetical protein [Vitiosangium sp. GDMCC 1.1324]|uniref:hypothetical protein n=1 Tax=Vitiosangium sp. (strain GDMCC 1.1324) TaxID=2138576 RepID=UPI000D3342E5|nr:hypothetical protein [Vitiosangium sp. GDMCC 1.1324]PTL84483.1 hypothetical protein DAT35_05175 [Vitiosangium sp. GDMCC 1.1324]
MAGRSVVRWVLASTLSLVGATGCGVEELSAEEQDLAPRTQEQALVENNGLSLNGLSLNGLSLNGLSLNGLSLNGLSTTDFANWFNSNPAGNEQLMRYMVRCAVGANETRSFVNPATGALYTWQGGLGLAPAWAGGAPATVVEQQIISACLAAHANNYGLHVSISVLGRDSNGANISFTTDELASYPKRESCFFGNVFTNEGLFAGNDRNSLAADESTSRPCGLRGYGALSNAECTQVKRIGQCEQSCTLDPNGTYYTKCTVNGVQYKPLTTRLRAEDIHHCGDGVCQQGERPGWGITADSCLLDCGSPAP